MVNPAFKMYDSTSTPSFLSLKNGYVEVKPYVGNNFYTKREGRSLARYDHGGVIMPVNDSAAWTWCQKGPIAKAIEFAVGDFRSEMFNNGSASIGIGIAQWDQTLGMASKRFGTLVNFAKRLPGASLLLVTGDYLRRKRALKALARSLNHPSNSSDMRRLYKRSVYDWRNRIKTPGDLWLEFWFGWSAIVADLSAVSKVLSDPEPQAVKLRGRSKVYDRKVFRTNGADGTWNQTTYEARVRGGASGTMTVLNPNAYLANRLGLVNLAEVAWDAIPFSWVLGWFGNFQTFLKSLTWETGVTVPMNTRLAGTYTILNLLRVGEYRNTLGVLTRFKGDCQITDSSRSKGWSGNPRLRLTPPTGNLTRVLSLSSVLLQQLSNFSIPVQFRK